MERWKEAAQVLELVGTNSKDLWGIAPEFYYTLAYCERRAGEPAKAEKTLAQARRSADHVHRFPYREESLPVLREAVKLDPNDATARFHLACLLYYRGESQEAIRNWEAAAAIAPDNFSSRRALGLAYAEQGYPVEKAATELEKAIALRPEHLKSTYDLGNIYARVGRLNDQLVVLNQALGRSPNDDDLFGGILTAELNEGQHDTAEGLIQKHTFATRHRRYKLRDKYRVLRYGEGAQVYHRGGYEKALSLFQSALRPPPSLGIDTFANQDSPRLEYYIGELLKLWGSVLKRRRPINERLKALTNFRVIEAAGTVRTSSWYWNLICLSRGDEGGRLEAKFEHFAETEMDDRQGTHRSEARYLLVLIDGHRGGAKFSTLLKDSLEARPDFLPARLELRGDTIQVRPMISQ